jgi:hypothetical protein
MIQRMTGENLKQAVIEYIKSHYTQKGSVPALKSIIEHFKGDGLNLTRFYRIFPGGMGEVCRLAGVPVPMERIKQTAKATEMMKAARIKGAQSASMEAPPVRLTLTEAQTRRLLGLSHLEGGKDPLVIVDELLDYDSKARRYGLTLEKMKMLSEFLEEALQIGWRIKSQPSIVEALTKAHNIGFLSWPPESAKFFVEVLEWARKKGWNPFDFADYVTRHHNELTYYMRYIMGEITFEEFKQRIMSYVGRR